MRRTTIAFEEDLLVQLKREAVARGQTVQYLVNALIRQALMAKQAEPYRLELPTVKGEILPGVRLDDRDALFNLMDGLDDRA